MMFKRVPGLALVALAAFGMPAQGQTYPTRPVTMVVPFPAGGSTDWLSRVLGQKLEALGWKQPFIIESLRRQHVDRRLRGRQSRNRTGTHL